MPACVRVREERGGVQAVQRVQRVQKRTSVEGSGCRRAGVVCVRAQPRRAQAGRVVVAGGDRCGVG